jgi:hypothetical protein
MSDGRVTNASGHNKIFNNVFAFNSTGGSGSLGVGYQAYISGQSLAEAQSNTHDGNIFWRGSSPGSIFYLYGQPGTDSLSDWQSWSGGDANSVVANPLLTNSALVSGFHLTASSLARALGVTPPVAVSDDYDGDPRPSSGADAGADQFVSPGLVTTPGWADLRLHYTFDETSGLALDSGITPSDSGTFINLAARTTSTPWGVGYALDLSRGNNDWVSAGNPAKLNGITNFTITTWLNLRADAAANDRLIDKVSTSGGFGWRIIASTAGSISASSFSLALQITLNSEVDLGANLGADHQWVFLAVTYDGTSASGNVKFYRDDTNNGVGLLGTASRSGGAVPDTTSELRIGSTPASPSDRTPPAWFDDVRVFSTVLSQADLEVVRQEAVPFVGVPVVLGQPSAATVPAGGNVKFVVDVAGVGTLSYQWRLNGVAIAGATAASYTVTNALPDPAGAPILYSVSIGNLYGSTNSLSAALTVTTPYNTTTTPLTGLWNLLPGDQPYLSLFNYQRGLAYNPTTTNLVLANRNGGTSVVVLNALTGAQQNSLNVAGATNGALAVNMVGVADDGVVYVGNLTTSAAATGVNRYFLFRWPNDSSSQAPAIAYAGDPGGVTYPGLRWDESIAVRGAGTNTQILLSPTLGPNIVTWLRTADGTNFQPTVLQITNAPSGFATVGLAWGPGTNTLFAKSSGVPLYWVQFDAASGLGFVKAAYSTNSVPLSVTAIAADTSRNLLGTLQVQTPDNVQLFSMANLAQTPLLLDSEAFTVANPNTYYGGVGSAAFGQNCLFVLDANNGIKAFKVTYAAPLVIASRVQGAAFVLSWPTAAGGVYQLQAKNSLTDLNWSSVGTPIVAGGAPLSVTNGFAPGAARQFYRVHAY